jgi:hypothetical protein
MGAKRRRAQAGLVMTTPCPRDHTSALEELDLSTGSVWEALEDLDLLSAHDEQGRVAIAKGTRLRVEQSLAAANVLFRFLVLEGAHAGDCVWLETTQQAVFPTYGLWPAL